MKAMFIQVNKCPVTTQSSHSAQERMATPLQSPYSTTLNQLLLNGGGRYFSTSQQFLLSHKY